MAEFATIARPYAEALFKSLGSNASDALVWLDSVAAVSSDAALRELAANPNVEAEKVAGIVLGVVGDNSPVAESGRNFVLLLAENGRLNALPEIAKQFRVSANSASGLAEGVVHTAFELDEAAFLDLCAVLEKRFSRRLRMTQAVDQDLIGGIRVVVGDEVYDTSIKARLEQMQVALTA
jgi:F-type H+-transporting ATPase subunit delta